jgi:hypothetical protein
MKHIGKMSFLLMSCLFAMGMLGSSDVAIAGELGHYMPGVASVRDFPVPSEPGIIYEQYNLYYTTDTYKDRDGNEADSVTIGSKNLKVEADIDTIAIQPLIIWTTDMKLLGARYAAFGGIPIVNASVQAALSTETRYGLGIDESSWGIGDIYIQPIWLGWNTKHFGTAISYGIYAPTGKYDDGDVDNTGLGFWTHQLQAGTTWYPWEHQGTAVMVNGTYEIHHDKDGADITPGDRFSLEWGISQFVPLDKEQSLLAEFAITGYSQWQVENDSGADVVEVLNVKDEIHAIGGQIGLAFVPWNASVVFRYLKEFEAEARYEGELFVLTLAKVF